jgi:sugar phosphate isomerase/epimerase
MKSNFITQIITITLSLTLLSGTLSCKSSTNKKTPADPAPELFFDLSLAQWSLHKTIRSGTMSPYDFAKVASEFGFKGLEYVNGLYPDVMNSENKTTALQAFVEKNKALAKQYNVKNVLIMIDDEGDLSSSEEQERMSAIENHKLWIDAAHQMGCTAVRLNLHGEKEEAKWIKNSIESLSALSEYAAPFNINVIVENHGGKSSNANLLMQVINQVNFSNCGTLPDFGNFCMSENWGSLKDNKCDDPYDPYLGVSEMLPKAFGMSAKSYEFNANGDETILDYYKLLSIVKKGGYDGFIGVEYEGEVLSEKEGILATKRLLEKVAATL